MTDETTKECACGECDTVTWCSREPLYVGSYVVSHIWLCNACVVKRAQERTPGAAVLDEAKIIPSRCRCCGKFRRDCTCRYGSMDEPRAIIRHFAQAMEAKLAANDGVKGGWRMGVRQADMMRWKAIRHLAALREEVAELEQAVIAMDSLRREVNAEQVRNILMEAADVANYALMVADVVGALPPTDERGR